ncbi:MAG: SPASM domain-containing protein [Chloroflexi bacterium]|nr:SPASM domain-containing protein [Chloroflexota bacterium]
MYLSRYVVYHDIDEDNALICSSLTGAVDLLDASGKAAWASLAVGSPSNIAPALLSALKRRGYVFRSPKDESRLFEKVAVSSSPQDAQLLRITICPTYQCNFACKYCFEGELPQRSLTTLSSRDVDRAFEAIDRIRTGRQARTSIELSGGEPLLPRNKAIVEQLFAGAAARGCGIGVVSNGSCLASHFAPLFIEHARSLAFVQTTLDGPEDVHNSRRCFRNGRGSFQEVVASIDFLVQNEMPLRLRVNIDPQNVSRLPEIADLAESRGWTKSSAFQCMLAPVLDHHGDSEYPHLVPEVELLASLNGLMARDPRLGRIFKSSLFRVIQHISSVIKVGAGATVPMFHYCEANTPDFFVFGADGYVYACGEAVGNPQMAIGTFLPGYEIWPEKENVWRGRSVRTIDACRQCHIAGFCGGGCTFSALAQHGTPNVGMCAHAHETLRHYLGELAAAELSWGRSG